MRPGERFEQQCYEYLTKHYETKETKFRHDGGMNSTKSDIAAIKNGEIVFYIEAKDRLAQSGQFVLLPDEEKKAFLFSPRNRSKPNKMTDIIIDYMNRDFQRFHHAGTAGQVLNIDASVFADWIVEYYKEKNVKYVISCDADYVIFPIRKFKQYFKVIANYRIKKSGSGVPAKRDISGIKQIIKAYDPAVEFSQKGKKLFVNCPEGMKKDRFLFGKYTYYLSKQGTDSYAVRRLSNTYHMNVIFSIELIKTQDKNDLEEFEADL